MSSGKYHKIIKFVIKYITKYFGCKYRNHDSTHMSHKFESITHSLSNYTSTHAALSKSTEFNRKSHYDSGTISTTRWWQSWRRRRRSRRTPRRPRTTCCRSCTPTSRRVLLSARTTSYSDLSWISVPPALELNKTVVKKKGQNKGWQNKGRTAFL